MLSEDTSLISVQKNEQDVNDKSSSPVVRTTVSNVQPGVESSVPESHPESIQVLVNTLTDNHQLTTLQYNTVMKYLSKQRNEQMKLEFGENSPRSVCVCGGHQNLPSGNIVSVVQDPEMCKNEKSDTPVLLRAVQGTPTIVKSGLLEDVEILLKMLSLNRQLTTLQINTIIRHLSKQRDEQIKLELGEDAPQSVCVCGGHPINVLDLPDRVKKLIFRCLPAEDLVNVLKVCKSWKAVTMETSFWKHAGVCIDQYLDDLNEMLPYISYLHTVTGFYEQGPELFDILVNNVIDLRRMDCTVFDVEEVDAQNFFGKFKNIEFIEMNSLSPGYVKTLDILSSSPKLKGLRLTYYEANLDYFQQFCNAIGDGFSALEELHINNISESECDSTLSDMLKKKIIQLTHLSLPYLDPNVFELILKSSKLERLRLEALPLISSNFGSMTNLKSLTLQFASKPHSDQPKKRLLDVSKELVFPQNIENLEIYFPDDECSKPYKGIVSNITSSNPHLKAIDMWHISDCDIDQQLEKIRNLQNLHTVSFRNCLHLTAKGTEYITECVGIRRLEISKVTLTDSTYERLKSCSYLVDLYLYSCVLNPEKLLPAISSMKYLANMDACICTDQRTGEEFNLKWGNTS